MNSVILIGRVGKDPDIKSFQDGNRIANLSLATSERWKDKSGEKKERVQWHNVVVRVDGLVGIVQQYVSKGDMLAVSGQLEYRQWEKDGVKHTSAEVVIGMGGKIELLGGKSSERDNDRERPAPRKQKSFAEDLDDSIDVPF
jgi:single-strand DNA-binding protein